MNERPTPETDALILSKDGFGATRYEWAKHSRRLERERDEAWAAIAGWENKWKWAVEMAALAEVERDEALSQIVKAECRAERFCQERDEAIADRDILRIDAQREAEHHDRMVSELEKVYKERDEAREALENHTVSTIHSCHDQCQRTMCVLRRERDEAREELARIQLLLLEPHAVFLNFLHGKIAKLDWGKLEHIHGPHPAWVERDEARKEAEYYRERYEQLKEEK